MAISGGNIAESDKLGCEIMCNFAALDDRRVYDPICAAAITAARSESFLVTDQRRSGQQLMIKCKILRAALRLVLIM